MDRITRFGAPINFKRPICFLAISTVPLSMSWRCSSVVKTEISLQADRMERTEGRSAPGARVAITALRVGGPRAGMDEEDPRALSIKAGWESAISAREALA